MLGLDYIVISIGVCHAILAICAFSSTVINSKEQQTEHRVQQHSRGKPIATVCTKVIIVYLFIAKSP